MEKTLAQLKSIMAAFNYYTAADIPAKYGKPQQDRPLSIPSGIPSTYAVGEFYQCTTRKNEDQSIYNGVERDADIILLKDGSTVPMMLKRSDGKYWFFIPYPYYRFSTRDLMKTAKQNAGDEPNRIGTWTTKKVDAWHDHICKYLEAFTTEKKRIADLYEQSKLEMEAIIESIQPERVSNIDGKTYAYKDGFTFTFELSKDNGVLYKRADFKDLFETALALVQRAAKAV